MREHGLSGNNVKFPSGFRFWCLVLAVYVMSAGCTRNNGDIGDWFGTWQMTEISVNGVAVGNYEKNIFWQFQNDIINLKKVETGEGEHSRDDRWGTWEESGNLLLLNFTYSDDKNPVKSGESGNGAYAPLREQGIPYGEVSTLTIENRSGSRMVLKYMTADNEAYTYVLKKQ